MSKICSDPLCKHKGEPQPEENFHKNNRNNNGLYHACKSCVSHKSSCTYKAKLDEKLKGKVNLPCAGSELVKQALEHELTKLCTDNIKSIKSEARAFSISKSNWFIPLYKIECQLAVQKLKALLQVPV